MRCDRRLILLSVTVFVLGCAPAVEQRVALMHGTSALLVPATGESTECLDRCSARDGMCLGSCTGETCELECHAAHEHCIEDCPGAHWSEVQPLPQSQP